MTKPVDFPPFYLRRRRNFVLHVKCYEKVVSALHTQPRYIIYVEVMYNCILFWYCSLLCSLVSGLILTKQ
jgi:hypothetical protein